MIALAPEAKLLVPATVSTPVSVIAPVALSIRFWPMLDAASTVARARMSLPGSKTLSCEPSRPRPRSPVRTPRTRPSVTSSFSPDVSGRIVVPPASACSASQRPSRESEATMFPWLRIVGGVGMRIALRFVR